LAISTKRIITIHKGRFHAVDEVFSELPVQVVPFITFLYQTGCRLDEALQLRHQEIDMGAGRVALEHLQKNTYGDRKWHKSGTGEEEDLGSV